MDKSSIYRQAHWNCPEMEIIIQAATFVMGFLPWSSNHIKEVVCISQHVSHCWVSLVFMELQHSDFFEESKTKKKIKSKVLKNTAENEVEKKQMARDSNLSQGVPQRSKTN